MGARKSLKLRELERILRSFGVDCDAASGKGGHKIFRKVVDGQQVSFPVPGDKEVKSCYVKGCRRRFGLMESDGVTDDDFYSRS